MCHNLLRMCRLFGFRSVIPSQVHRSLVAADNALSVQSHRHPDGWGVAHYVEGAPHLTKSPQTALGDALFHRLSGVVASETVVAHVRQATQGENTVLNCHPFQYGRWVFAHNGDIENLADKRPALRNAIEPQLLRYVLGETDSELIFFLFLTEARRKSLADHGATSLDLLSLDELVAALRAAIAKVRALCDEGKYQALLTVVLTDGRRFIAAQGGKQLFFSTYKHRCADRDSCASLSAECEAKTTSGRVNHLIVSSEVLQGENVWEPLAPGEILAVDELMVARRSRVDRVELPLLPAYLASDQERRTSA